MLSIHPNARTTPAVRAEIARSAEPTGQLARRYGVSTETVRKWRQRGPGDCLDRSARPHKLPWKASEEERAVVCALRRATGFPLDDLTCVVRHFLPHLGRDNVYRILKAAGLSRRPAPAAPERPAGKFKEYELGFVHLDVKHLPKLRTSDGECRKRYLFVAIDRRSRSVHLAVKDDETEASAKAFLEEALAAFPFRVTHVLTDRGSCFTAEGFEKLCRSASSTARPSPTRRAPTGWSSASTGACSARCSGSPSPATATWSGCWPASTRPTTPAASACWAGARPRRSSRSAWGRIGASPIPATAHRRILASYQGPCWSSSGPRTSRNQTPSPTVAAF
jgi:transposase